MSDPDGTLDSPLIPNIANVPDVGNDENSDEMDEHLREDVGIEDKDTNEAVEEA